MKLDHLSWSQLNRLATCGQQYVYAYIEKIRRPPGFALIRGKSVDLAVTGSDEVQGDLKHKLETGELLSAEALDQLVSDVVDRECKGEVVLDGDYEGMTLSQAKGVVKDEAMECARRYHRFVAPEITPRAVQARVELPESGMLPVKVVGVLDVIDETPGRVGPRDLKTKRKAPNRTDADDSEQLTLYALQHRALYKEMPEQLSLDFVWRTPGGKVDHQVQATTRTREDFLPLVRTLEAARKAIEAEVFIPRPVRPYPCSEKWCGYFDRCPYARRGSGPTT